MRLPKCISPSALAKFEKNPEEYYMTYLAPVRVPRDPQSEPASVGSAFDAFVKARLAADVLGVNYDEEFNMLFESQVEEHNLDMARRGGERCMASYVHSGAYQDLLDMMEGAQEAPQFEFTVDAEIDGVPILGKPDCRFVNREGAHVILDWKVNGYCGRGTASPYKGFAIVRDGLDWPKPSRGANRPHKLYEPTNYKGIEVNSLFMEDVSIDWADQLAMYGWMMGEEIGNEDVIVCIDQIVAKAAGKGGLKDGDPLLRVASHRTRVSNQHQIALANRIKIMWDAIHNDHVFLSMSKEDSQARCAKLSARSRYMVSDGSRDGDFLARCAREKDTFYKGR